MFFHAAYYRPSRAIIRHRLRHSQVARLLFGLMATTIIIATGDVACGQFNSGGGFFENLMNAAAPRMNVPLNAPPATTNSPIGGAWPGYATAGTPNYGSSLTFNNSTSSYTPSPWGYGNNQAVAPKDWRLGVETTDLDMGSQIRFVQQGSPAQRAGIEVDDLIVTVGGIQVGNVAGRLNQVGDQIRRSVDTNGRVSVLVQDSRTRQIQALVVDLDNAATGITGSVMLRDATSLPYQSVLSVQIENATRPFYEVRNGKVVSTVYGTGPFPFEVHYDPAYVDSRDQYRLNASITTRNGQVLYALRQPIPIPAGGLPPNAQLILENARDLQLWSTSNVDVTSAYSPSGNALEDIYRQILSRSPSPNEQVAWNDYMAQGNSITNLQAKLIGSPNFYDRVGNNPSTFVQAMIRTFSKREATANEMNAWLGRLQQYNGNREMIAREFLQQLR